MESELDKCEGRARDVQHTDYGAGRKIPDGAADGRKTICAARSGTGKAGGGRAEKNEGDLRYGDAGEAVGREIPDSTGRCDDRGKFWAAAGVEWRGAVSSWGRGPAGDDWHAGVRGPGRQGGAGRAAVLFGEHGGDRPRLWD